MPDLALRFHKDVLVLSTSVASALSRLGVDAARDAELTLLLEPETIEEICKLEIMAGAQCLVAPTWALTPARLAHAGMEARAVDLARQALACVRSLNPQHVLVEVGPCGLPLDPSSKGSLNENLNQYARAARLFEAEEFDAYFLNGFASCDDLKCALMGVRKVSDAPIVASVRVEADGHLACGRGTWREAVEVMGEYGASVVGFETGLSQEEACGLALQAVEACNLPILAQLRVAQRQPRQQGATADNPYYCADTMMAAADALRRAGVQFLRAVGDATPAYTGALVATTLGSDAVLLTRAASEEDDGAQAGVPQDELAALAEAARARVSAALSAGAQGGRVAGGGDACGA